MGGGEECVCYSGSRRRVLAVSFAQSDPTEKPARAILETKCAACHGPARMSELDLRERDTILKGGKRGPAVVPGKADESLLYKAVRREGEVQMPPGKTALTAAEVNAIRDWINAGAKWTSTTPRTRRRNLVVLQETRAARRARGEETQPRPQSHRRLYPCQARREETPSRSRSRPPHLRPPRLFRSPRTAAHSRAGGRVRQRQVPRRLREAGRPPARLAALRRALGPLLARPGALRRHLRLRDGPLLHHRLALSRLGDRVVQSRQALHHLRAGTDRSRRAVAHQHGVGRLQQAPEREGGERPPPHRHQPLHRRLLPHRVHLLRRSVPRRMGGRRRRYRRRCVPRSHRRMRPLPRPQIRPHQPA